MMSGRQQKLALLLSSTVTTAWALSIKFTGDFYLQWQQLVPLHSLVPYMEQL